MTEVKVTRSNPVNVAALVDRLPPGVQILLAGFTVRNGVAAPASGPVVVSEMRSDRDGVLELDTADPGEIRVATDEPLTPAQWEEVQQIIATHDATEQRTDEQQRADDVAALAQTLDEPVGDVSLKELAARVERLTRLVLGRGPR